MGYVAFINGTGMTVKLDDSGAQLVKSIITCEGCGDDRVFEDRICYVCHKLIKREV